MGWGGGGGGGWASGPSAAQSAAAAGLPFAGVPSELKDQIEGVLDTEPEHPPTVVDFSESTYDRRPVSMRLLLGRRKLAVAVVILLIVVETIASRLGPPPPQPGPRNRLGPGPH